jgi:hypothetical protein
MSLASVKGDLRPAAGKPKAFSARTLTSRIALLASANGQRRKEVLHGIHLQPWVDWPRRIHSGSVAVGVVYHLVGTPNMSYEWVVSSIGAFIGGFIASEWIIGFRETPQAARTAAPTSKRPADHQGSFA